MVLFITCKSAYQEMEEYILSGKYPVWLSKDALSEEEENELWRKEVDLSVFSHPVDTSNSQALKCAISTIKEHHFGKHIWVQINNEII